MFKRNCKKATEVTQYDVPAAKHFRPQDLPGVQRDELTGLVGPSMLEARLASTIERARESSRPFALICCDIDDFTFVNETLGRPVGDRLLQLVGERLRSVVGPNDIVARLRRDEFAVLIDDPRDGSAVVTAERILDAVNEPVTLGEHELRPEVSLGIAWTNGDESVAELLYQGDVAVNRAKMRRARRDAAREELVPAVPLQRARGSSRPVVHAG